MKVNLKKLNNGIQILSHNIPESKIFNLNIVIKFGVRDQKQTEPDFTHLVEHLMMNSSKLYPKLEDTAVILENAGAFLNAHVNPEGLILTGESLIDYWEEVADIMFDKLLSPNITKDFIDKELKTLKNEYDAQINNIEKYLEKNLILFIFPDSKFVLNPQLEKYPLDNIEASKVKLFHQRILHPELISFIGVGNLQKTELVNKINTSFSKLDTSNSALDRIKPHVGHIKSINLKGNLNKKITHLRFGFATVERSHKLSVAFDIVNSYLGKGYRSKLFTELRLKHNLIYSHISKVIYFSDTGLLYFGFSTTQPEKAEQVIRDNLEKWLVDISEDDLTRLKTKIINSAKFTVFSSQKNIANIYSNVLTSTDKIETLEDYIKKVEEVTLDDIRQVSDMLSLNKMYTLKYD